VSRGEEGGPRKGGMNSLLGQVLESWDTHNRINLFLVEAIDEEGMRCTLSKRAGEGWETAFDGLCHKQK